MIEYYQNVADLWPRYGEIDSTIVHQAIVVSLINLEMTSVCPAPIRRKKAIHAGRR